MTNVMETGQLVPLPIMQAALARATENHDLAALKDVAAMAAAFQTGAKVRNLGIEAENQAAELVIRTERAMGVELRSMRNRNVFLRGGHRKAFNLEPVVEALRDGPLPLRDICERTGLTPAKVSPLLSTNTRDKLFVRNSRSKPTTWSLDPRVLANRQKVLLLSELGVSNDESSNYQAMAGIPEEEFEAAIAVAKDEGKRLARLHFYVKGRPMNAAGIKRKFRVADNGYDEFRRGAMALLGWHVNAAGEYASAHNELLTLEAHELALVKRLLQALVDAYGEAVKARRP
jgi:hypothetical protein